MTLHEPLTAVTDFLLAALCLFFFASLSREFSSRRQLFVLFWAGTFLMAAVGALAGGISHGFKPYFSELVKILVWKTAVFSIGIASLGMLGGTILLSFRRSLAGRILMGAAFLKFFVFAGVMARSDRFLYVIIDYLFSMAVVLLLSLKDRSHPGGGSSWIAAGLLLSFAAAGVQQSALFWGPLNHNDLYHVIQMLAFTFLFKGVKLRSSSLEPPL